MRSLLVAAFVLASCVPAYAQDFSGVYTVVGLTDKGDEYDGVLDVSRTGDVYAVHWYLRGGDEAWGYAIKQGDAIAYICRSLNGGIAFGSYRLGKDGKWSGIWSVPVPGAPTFPETATPSKRTVEQLQDELKAPRRTL